MLKIWLKVFLLCAFICRYVDNPKICTNPESCQPENGKKSKLAVYVTVPVVLVVVIVSVAALLYFLLLRRKKQGDILLQFPHLKHTTDVCCMCHSGLTTNIVKPQNETPIDNAQAAPLPSGDASAQSSLHIVKTNRRFTYKELGMITNNFQRVLGRGGFGKVYDGFLEDGTQVAVKLRSQSSNQGVKEFLLEVKFVQNLHQELCLGTLRHLTSHYHLFRHRS